MKNEYTMARVEVISFRMERQEGIERKGLGLQLGSWTWLCNYDLLLAGSSDAPLMMRRSTARTG